jgi:hypothetical protein
MSTRLRLPRLLGALLLCAFSAMATEYHGHVIFGGLPLPGATLTASQGDKKFVATTGLDGFYSFPDLPDGDYTVEVEMLCFARMTKSITIAFGVPTAEWDMKLLSVDAIRASAQAAPPEAASPAPGAPAMTTSSTAAPAPAPAAANGKGKKSKTPAVAAVNTASAFQRTNVNAAATPPPPSDAASAVPTADQTQNASDSLAINGSVNNGAASPFGQSGAFGNNRRGPGSLYNGAIQLTENNSALDAQNYSTTGQNTPKPGQNLFTFGASVGGPVRIPHLVKPSNQPWFFFVGYQLTRNHTATTQPALVPAADQRSGIFSQSILDPSNGNPFPNNTIPVSRLSTQALSLLKFYPLPNFIGSSRYNYQTAIHQSSSVDALQSRLNKNLNRTNQVAFQYSFQDARNQNNNLFGFLDHSSTVGYDVNGSWNHRFTQRLFMTYKLDFSRQTTETIPFFENKENVSGEAGITGNNQSPLNWGPPNLGFASIYGLSDANQSSNHNQTADASLTGYFIRAPHNFQFSADYKRQHFNALSQQNARGSFNFTGAATGGSDFADFLLGVPDTASIAFGNADKYFRSNVYNFSIKDDWRLSPGFTANIGVRYVYSSPISEVYGRLVNLDVTNGFGAEAPVIGYNPTGSLAGNKYPASLVRPDRIGFEPQIGIAWRPISGSSLVVRAGYGLDHDTSVYQTIATRMAQQSPLSKSFSVQNSLANPLTLANGFNVTPSNTPNTFAIDPNFRIGYVHSWNVSLQRDLPLSLILNASYLGIKGTRAAQQFYPNTYAPGAFNPCPSCPSGYAYETSNGNSTHEEGKVQVRRRLHNGLTAAVIYTFAKSIDDAGLGGRGAGSVTAQNWLNLSAERGLSPFDQRHVVNFNMQYTTGVGAHSGMLMDGWRGTVLKEWTITTNISAGTGMPLTPNYFGVLTGTGCSSCLRGQYTGASVYNAPSGLFLNPAAYTAPPSGQYGNAGRNSIEGPDQFSLNAQMARTFRYKDRYNMDILVNSTNSLNHVSYTSWITQVNSLSFGAPAGASGMRVLQATLRMRF